MRYTVIYEKGPASWGAYVPDLPGVVVVGDTRDEAESLIREAAKLQLEGLRETGQSVPQPTSFAGEIEISR
jgi:predicted RNase H-like HicB family nuclease